MARKPARQVAAPGLNMRKILLTLALIALIAAIIPGIVVVAIIGMLPSFVALLVDRSPQKYQALCVGGMNWCGVFPYVLDVFASANSFDAAKSVLSSPIAFLVMWGCAAFGYLIFTVVPPLVGTFLTVMAQRRIAMLRATQRRLIEEWGDDIARPVRDR